MRLNESTQLIVAHRKDASFAAYTLMPLVLAFAVIALTIFTPGRAWAFSLGKIRVTGALTNQFKAEIPVQADGQEGLIVMLGSEADYKKLGLKRPDFLDSLQVQMGDHPMSKGDKIIYITSPDPIYQPSFNLVVKAYMNGGHIVENYFLALDFQKNITMEIASSREEEKTDLSAAALDIQKEKQKPSASPSDGPAIAAVRQDETDAAKREDEIRAALRGELPVAEPLTYSKEQSEKRRLDEIRASEEALSEQERAKPVTEPVATPAKEPLALQPTPAPAPAPAPVVEAKAEEPVEIVIKEEKPAPTVAEVKPVTSGVRFKMYKVESGDSLYAISRKVGVEDLDMDRLVVAVWKENTGKFIKGNLHGIRAGTKLDYEKAVDTARSISRNEARQIISDQWEEWKKLRVKFVSPTAVALAEKKPVQPAPAKEEKKTVKEKAAPAVKPEQVAAKPEPAKAPDVPVAPADGAKKEPASNYGAILKALAEWKTAQGPSWEGAEMDVLSIGDVSAKGLVDVKIAKRGPGGMEGISIQLKKESSGFKPLTAMKSVSTTPPPASFTGKPFTAQVGAFREKADAEEMVKILRKKGHNAYLAASTGKGGPVYRVALDRFSTVEDAANFSEALRKSGLIKFSRALKLPYALRFGEPMGVNDANSKVAELASKGVSAYIVSAGEGKAFVMTGAYESEKAAREAVKQISKGGLNPSVIQP